MLVCSPRWSLAALLPCFVACSATIGGARDAERVVEDASAGTDVRPSDLGFADDAREAVADAMPATDALGFEDAQPRPDAAALDAAALDAAAPDGAPPDTGPLAGDCTGSPICDDFESYAAGSPPGGPWTPSVQGGAVAIDETRARSGRRSVRVTTDGMSSYRRAYIVLQGAPTFPLPGNVMWGRAMMWLTAAPTGSVHWTNIEGEGDVTGRGFRALSRYGGQHQKRLMANYETRGVRTDCWDHSRTTFPEGRWACFEWRFNGPGDEMNLWVDGAPINDVTVVGRGEGCIAHDLMDQWPSPQYDTLRLGWEHYQSTIAHELWIDDVAVGSTRIGCP